MGAQPDLTTRLIKQPKTYTREIRRRDAPAPRGPGLVVKSWWASYAVLALGIGFALLWSTGSVPHDESVGAIVAWGATIDSLCLMVLSVIVAVLLGEARGQPSLDGRGAETDESRRRRATALRCWWASVAITAIGVASQILWNDPGPPYGDSFGEAVWFLWIVGAWCLLLFSAVVAGILGEARAQPALRAKAAEVVHLRASRGRLVDASDAARRAIERDLHDGVQPRLVALMLNVSMARRAGQFDGAPSVIDDIEHELREILREIRALASGILPPALTDLGLEAAATELTGRMPFRVDLSLPAERLPGRAEVTAYFVIAEALTNAAKHADPSRVTVRVTIRGERVTVEVHDDGRGGADADGGTGLVGLADRVDTLDGRLTVASPPGAGTTVTAVFSCAS